MGTQAGWRQWAQGGRAALLALLLGAGAAQAQQPRTPSLHLTLGAGVEGYTGDVGVAYGAGPLGGVTVRLQALPSLGAELGYAVGLHQVNTGTDGGLVDGYDLVHHGVHAALTLGPELLPGVRAYALAGAGASWTDVRVVDHPLYHDDGDTFVPLGAGLSVTAGRVALDARLSYQLVFGQGSVRRPGGEAVDGNRYQGLVGLSLRI